LSGAGAAHFDAAARRSELQPHGDPPVKHSDEGALGLVVNRPLVTTGRVTVNLDPPVSTDRELQVWVGGPVEPQRTWILVGQEPEGMEELTGMRVADDLYLSTSPDLLRQLLGPT